MTMEEKAIHLTPDALIAMAVWEAEAREMAALPPLQEMNENFQPSEGFKRKIQKMMVKKQRQEKLKTVLSKLKKALIALTMCCTVFFCALLPAHAVQVSIVQTVVEWRDNFVAWVFSSEGGMITFPDNIEFNYVPEGYELIEKNFVAEGWYTAVYINESGESIVIRVIGVKDKRLFTIDNEQTHCYELNFSGNNAIWYVSDDGSEELVWESNGLIYYIYGTIGIHDMIIMAQNISAT